MCATSASLDQFKSYHVTYPPATPTFYPNTYPLTGYGTGTSIIQPINTGNPKYDELLKTLDFPGKRICDFTAADFEKVIHIVKVCIEYDKENREPECVDPNKATIFDAMIDKAMNDVALAQSNHEPKLTVQYLDVVERLMALKRYVTESESDPYEQFIEGPLERI